jgi:DNA repair exonuclease SbcCD ATPase subunit
MDDIVINTEIDKLIDLLSQKKRIELDELARQLGIDKKKIKKWLLVLEDEGYLKLEYRLTRTFAVWLLDLGSSKAMDLPHVTEEQVKETAEEAIAEVEIPPAREEAQRHEGKRGRELSRDNMMPKKIVRGTEGTAPSKEAGTPFANIGERMAGYAEEAETLSSSIKELEAKQGKLAAELPELERYGKEKVDSITEKVTALQKRISGLKKELKSAEEMASNMGQRGRMAKELVDEASGAYMKLDSLLRGFKDEARRKSGDAEKGITGLETEVMEEQERLSALEDAYSLIEKARKDTERKAESIRESAAAISKQLEGAISAVDAMNGKRDDFAARVSKARKSISVKKSEIESLKKEAGETGKLEAKLDRYLDSYMRETDEIRLLVTKAESEIRDIDEKASARAIESYLDELERTSSRIDQRLREISEGEAKIGEEIAQKKSRLRKIASESKEMAKKLKGQHKK